MGITPRGSRMQQRIHVNITRPLISTQAYNSVEKKKQKTHDLRIQMLAGVVNWHPLKLCCHLKKKNNNIIKRCNAMVERGSLFCVLSHKNDIRPSCVISYVFSYHIGRTCPVEEGSWSRNGCPVKECWWSGVDEGAQRPCFTFSKR